MQQQHSDKIQKRGFTTITSVIILMIATVLIITSTILISTDSFVSSYNSLASIEARALAHSCAEIALNKLKLDDTYAGNETLSFGGESCHILPTAGTGNTDRAISTYAIVRDVTRKVDVSINTVNPTTVIASWNEVADNTTTVPEGNCAVTYRVTNQWVDGFTADVIITNTSTTDINGWSMSWNFPGNQQVTNAWNIGWSQAGTLFSGSDLGYNSLIGANGGSQTIGFQAYFTGSNYAPVDSIIIVNGESCNVTLENIIEDPGNPPDENVCSVTYNITNQWGNGFNADVIITNLSANNIYGWTLVWGFSGNQQITNAWNTSWSQSGATVTAQNLGYNNTIPGNNGTQSFGFQASYSGTNNAPVSADFTLNGIQCQ